MKIITAIGNEEINQQIKEKHKYEILFKDIQYQEALIEILEKNNNINLLILSNILPGELDFCELINIIKYKKEKMKIFIILDKQNDNITKFLIQKGITNIFINNKITMEELIEKIEKINEEKIEIRENTEIINLKIKEKVSNIKNILSANLKRNNKIKKTNKISIIGAQKVGKSIFLILLALNMKNKKILLVSFEKNDINIMLGKKVFNDIQRYNNNIDLIKADKMENLNKIKIDKYDYIFYEIENLEKQKKVLEKSNKIIMLVEPNLIGIRDSKIILEETINEWKIEKERIKIIYNKTNIFSINKKILDQLFSDFEILGSMKNNDYYNLLINKNCKIIIQKISKEYKKIIEKI